MSDNITRVVLATADRVLAESLARCLDAEEDLACASVVTTPDDSLNSALNQDVQIVVFDVDFPVVDTFQVVARLKAAQTTIRLVILAGRHTDILIEQALQLKVDGYLSKTDSVADFLAAIRDIAAGRQQFSDAVKSRLRFDPADGSFRLETEGKLSSLTMRQLEVLRHLARGLSTKEIAEAMQIADKAVESHKYRIMKKLDLHDRVELTRYAIREGLVQP